MSVHTSSNQIIRDNHLPLQIVSHGNTLLPFAQQVFDAKGDKKWLSGLYRIRWMMVDLFLHFAGTYI